MKAFTDLGVFGAFLAARAVEVEHAAHSALEHGAAVVRDEARLRIGTYQSEVGGFAEWSSLTEATHRERVRLGYSPDDPLLRSGDLRKAITSQREGNEAAAGVLQEASGADGRNLGNIAIWQELGTARIPPRAFLGPAGFVKADTVAELIGKAVTQSLAGKE